MKKIIVLTLAILIANSSAVLAHDGESENERKFGGPVVQTTEVGGNREWLIGGYFGRLVNDHLAVGIAAFGLVSGLEAEGLPESNDGTNFSYGGLFVATPLRGLGVVSVVPSLMVGAGTLEFDGPSDGIKSRDELFVLEPTLTLQVRATSFMRVDLGAGYRMVRGVDTPGLSNDSMSHFSARMGVSFGAF